MLVSVGVVVFCLLVECLVVLITDVSDVLKSFRRSNKKHPSSLPQS